MAKVVAAHGVGQEYRGSAILQETWLWAMRAGLERVGYPKIADGDLAVAFYGDLFRPPARGFPKSKDISHGSSVASGGPGQAASRRDQYPRRHEMGGADSLERDLLNAWHQRSADFDPKARKRRTSYKPPHRSLPILMYTRLFGSKFFTAIGRRPLFGYARQMSIYMQDRELSLDPPINCGRPFPA